MNTKELLLELSRQQGVSGREEPVADFLSLHAAAYGPVTKTALGSLICAVRPPKLDRPHLVLVAHMDEIGFVVTYIDDRGFLKVSNCGGIDRKLLPASQVVVHTRTGDIPGIICSTPPHLQGEDRSSLQAVEDIVIDIGCSQEKAKAFVRLGDTVTFYSEAKELLGEQVCGKALDDRACCAAILKACELLGDTPLDIGLSAVFSTMEEVGSQGAKTATWQLAPTHGIALDVSFGHTPEANIVKTGKMKGGPMIGIAPVLDTAMTDRLFALAEAENLPCQTEVMSGSTGTDADAIATSRSGVRTALVSIPQRYMHSPVEVIAVEDVENTAKLLVAYIKDLSKGEN